jgi:hypothetical protein
VSSIPVGGNYRSLSNSCDSTPNAKSAVLNLAVSHRSIETRGDTPFRLLPNGECGCSTLWMCVVPDCIPKVSAFVESAESGFHVFEYSGRHFAADRPNGKGLIPRSSVGCMSGRENCQIRSRAYIPKDSNIGAEPLYSIRFNAIADLITLDMESKLFNHCILTSYLM